MEIGTLSCVLFSRAEAATIMGTRAVYCPRFLPTRAYDAVIENDEQSLNRGQSEDCLMVRKRSPNQDGEDSSWERGYGINELKIEIDAENVTTTIVL